MDDTILVRRIDPDAEGSFLVESNASKTWIGVNAEDWQTVMRLLAEWLVELSDDRKEVLGKIHVILCENTRDLTDLGGGGAFVTPFSEDGGATLDFLMMLPVPTAQRGRVQELDHLRATTAHELEHVWQFLTIRSTRLEGWIGFGEMSAVLAEIRCIPGTLAHLDYGVDFLRHLADGPLSSANEGAVYWFYPFVARLDRALIEKCGVSEGCRGMWKEWNKYAQIGRATSPWELIDEHLQEKGYSLAGEWIEFCLRAIHPPPDDEILGLIAQRFPERLPSWRGNFESSNTPRIFNVSSRPLSAHWIHLKAGGSALQLSWQLQSAKGQLFAYATSDGKDWTLLGKEAYGEGQLDAGTNWDVVMVNAFVPSSASVVDLASHPLTIEVEPVVSQAG